jgi:Tol biopolymer transport system component
MLLFYKKFIYLLFIKKIAMNTKNYLMAGLMLIFAVSCAKKDTGLRVVFPNISEPVQITSNDKEHFFASYYGIDAWSKDQRYALVLQTDIKHRLPDENDPATLGLVDMKTKEFIPLAQTRAWNFQEGCMGHWLETNPDSLIIYNDFRDGKYVSVIMNVHTRQEIRVIPYPVSAVSPNGKEAVSINFSRLRITRTDYGYGGEGQDSQPGVQFPDDDGLFLVDLETGEAKLIVTIAEIKDMVPDVPEEGIEYFCHTRFSRGGSKIFWLARAIPQRNTTAFTVNTDGSKLQRCFPDRWDGSHFDWLNDDELMITANYEGKHYAHVLFTVGQQDYRRVGNGILDYDGHGTFSPDGKWMVTDTYPNPGLREQKIYLMEMGSGAVLPLGRFPQPVEYTGFWRCDLHCRWSRKGDMIGFNSTHTGSRQVYVMNLK